MSTSEIQKQLRDAVDTACNELERRCDNLRKANLRYSTELAEDRGRIRRLAEMCGVDRSGSIEAMVEGIRDHIDDLNMAKQFEPEGKQTETVVCRFEPLNAYELQLKARVDELVNRMAKLNDHVNDCALKVAKRMEDMAVRVAILEERLR